MGITREEKEQTGKYVLQMARLLEDGCYQQEMLLKAVHIIDEALEQEPTTKNNTVDFNKINELADFAIKATGQRDSYSQGMCNGIEYLRATLTDTKPKYIYSNDEYKEPTAKNDLGVDLISRKAVIDELKRYFHDEYYQRTSIQDCRDCFIEDVLNHLPSITPQPCEDAISRQALLNATVNKNSIWNKITNSKGENLEAIISKLPPVTPQEPRKGHWIPRNSFLLQYECSECGWESERYNFCPNCGVKMTESEET